MGYFSNGTEGMIYEERYCNKCVHQEPFCAVWYAHYVHNYDDCNKPDSILHLLIPRSKNGLGNEQCTMFYDGKEPNGHKPEIPLKGEIFKPVPKDGGSK